MTEEMDLKEIMQTEIFTLFPEDLVERAVKIFRANKFHHLPVVTEEKEVVGMVSVTDLDRISYGHSLFEMPNRAKYDQAIFRSMQVKDIMTAPVVCLSPEDSIDQAYHHFKEGNFRALPIIERGHLIGIVTPIDLIGALLASRAQRHHDL